MLKISIFNEKNTNVLINLKKPMWIWKQYANKIIKPKQTNKWSNVFFVMELETIVFYFILFILIPF